RLRGLDYSGDEEEFSDEDRSQVILANNQLYEHSILRINYMTYDLHQEQDSINPQNHADIMMLLHENDDNRHPYWYACIIKIFHVNVWYYAPGVSQTAPTHMHVLFVHWFGQDVTFKAGWSVKQLHHIGFFSRDDPDSFSFVDPNQVIWGVHLIPGFAYGQTDTQLGPLFVHPLEDKDMDYMYFYVNHFVDQDMFMDFRGGSVGHKMLEDLYELLQSEGTVENIDENDELMNFLC
ncbi:hypothetical protein BDR04DRAFT_998991, partial [Suillus decipiens]